MQLTNHLASASQQGFVVCTSATKCDFRISQMHLQTFQDCEFLEVFELKWNTRNGLPGNPGCHKGKWICEVHFIGAFNIWICFLYYVFPSLLFPFLSFFPVCVCFPPSLPPSLLPSLAPSRPFFLPSFFSSCWSSPALETCDRVIVQLQSLYARANPLTKKKKLSHLGLNLSFLPMFFLSPFTLPSMGSIAYFFLSTK